MIPIQVASATVVGQVLSGKNLDRVLEQITLKPVPTTPPTPPLTPNERAAVHSISFDTLRHYGLLTAQLDLLLTGPMSDAPVRHLLLVALAQLQFSKASDHAIVDHAVSATEALGFPRAKSLVNAVLRNYLRTPDKFARERFKVDTAIYDFPRWWIERIKREQPDGWHDALLSSREHPPMCLRVNRRLTNPTDYLAKLAKVGIAAVDRGAGAIELTKPTSVHELPGFSDGLVSVQDEGAQWAAQFLDVKNGMRVLDACAAPGGKAGHLLEIADIDLTAIDSDRHRLKRVADNVDRLKLKAKLKNVNAAEPDTWWDKKPFDRILLDVPCSGSGVARRHPDIKWIRRETDLGSFARQQARLLESLWSCLGVDGKLLYVTCSVFKSENQDIIDAFLKTHLSAKQLELTVTSRLPGCGNDHKTPETKHAAWPTFKDGQLLPDEHHDGFYFALLTRTKPQ